MAKRRVYKRKSNGQFGTGTVAKKTTTSKKTTATKGKSTSVKNKNLIKKTGSVAAARADRARLAIKKLKAAGVTIAPGTLKQIQGLKKGESVRLPGGRVVTRSQDNTYTVTGKKTSAKNNAATKARTPRKKATKSRRKKKSGK
jgi:hypothetical protein